MRQYDSGVDVHDAATQHGFLRTAISFVKRSSCRPFIEPIIKAPLFQLAEAELKKSSEAVAWQQEAQLLIMAFDFLFEWNI